ncbi:DUF4365 domain-containing protein [Dietzia sp. PP-33]|jgi:hypothetical protein|uniref:DUF4365 domain-containing protein n=1 Tax=Dietzia sp. PP-33 TaxID=2957500 RepID=UPI0029C0232D|nr:DUF4365 domain-containing protein [Dietzia sp. PP-33]
MRASTRSQTGAIGERAVAMQFEKLGWGVAENPTQHDLGTDLWLQARDERRFDLGALVGAQVKAGESWFSNPHHEDGQLVGWWFSDSDGRHVKYWTDHRVPHLLILHSIQSGVSYWVQITRELILSTGKGAKLFVPKANTVDSNHFGRLVQVALGDRAGHQWEGSTWNGGSSILRSDRLRFALLTPRLIAPHPNLTVTELTAESSIALLIKMRLRDLDPKNRRETKAPSVDEARQSEDWTWQLYAAMYDALVNGETIEVIQSLIDTAVEPFQRASAAAIFCAMVVEEGKPQRGLEAVSEVLERDDCGPVDHAWLLTHKARCLTELGCLEQAYDFSVEVQNIRGNSTDDPTVMAIVGSSSDLIFTISGWHSSNIPAAITGRDTLAAWWRTQEVAWGLQHNWQLAFKQWAHDPRRTFGAIDETWLRIRTASLIAGMSADHSAWRYATGMLGERILTAVTAEAGHTEGAEALGMLRRAGLTDSLKLAVRQFLRTGPAQAAMDDAASIDLELSTRTSFQADLEMLRQAADVLPALEVDRHIRWILRGLQDLTPIFERARPTFAVKPTLLDTLTDLAPGASETVISEVIKHLVALPPQNDQGDAHHYAALMSRIPDVAWTDSDRESLSARPEGDNFELGEAITILLARTDPSVREAQRKKIASGDLAALRAFGDIRELDSNTAKSLIEHLTESIYSEVRGLENGEHHIRSIDFASTLALINRWHPSVANWDSFISLLTARTLFSEHLSEPLKQLKWIGSGIPASVIDALEPILKRILENPPQSDPFFGSPDMSGHAAAALAAIRPGAVTNAELWKLLKGDQESRAAAVRVVAGRDNPGDLMTLAVFAQDPEAPVRATVAVSLARWAVEGIADQPALQLLTQVLQDPGTYVARSVAAQLAQMAPSDVTAPLIEALRDHRSSAVRRAVQSHESTAR